MNPSQIKQYKILALSLVMTAILLIGAFFIYDTFTFRITSQDPNNNQDFPMSATVAITFNKPLADISKQNVNITPAIEGEWIVKDNMVMFQPYNLFEQKAYTISLAKIVAQNGKELTHEFSFNASAEIDFSEEQEKRALEQTDAIERQYTVLEKNFVPYRDSNYVIEYSFPDDEEELMTLTVSFTPPEYIAEDPAAYEQFVKENTDAAKLYLTSKGIDLKEYRLEFDAQL